MKTKNIVTWFMVGFFVIWLWNSIMSSRQATLNVDVAVVTAGQSVIRMPNVTLYLLDEQAVQQIVNDYNNVLNKEFKRFKKAYAEAPTQALKTEVSLAWHDERDAVVNALLKCASVGYVVQQEQTTVSPNRIGVIRVPSQRTTKTVTVHLNNNGIATTDLNGQASFRVKKSGNFLLFGFGQRAVGLETEYYCWVQRRILNTGVFGSTYSASLSNEQDAMGNYPDYLREHMSHNAGFQAGPLVGVLTSTFGYNPPSLD